MKNANDYQVGGDHYKKFNYQFWDFAIDAELSFLVGNACKYVARWRDKNGVQDLEKARHYLQKASDTFSFNDNKHRTPWVRFTEQLGPDEVQIFNLIRLNCYRSAIEVINQLIDEQEKKHSHENL